MELTCDAAALNNCRIEGEVSEAVSRLKQEAGKNIMINGSAALFGPAPPAQTRLAFSVWSWRRGSEIGPIIPMGILPQLRGLEVEG